MPITEIRGGQIKDTSVQRADLDISTTGSAVVRRIIAGTNVTIGSTGVDTGTGDVTINASGGGTVPTLVTVTTTGTLSSTTLVTTLVNSASATTQTLPAAPTTGTVVKVKNINTGAVTVAGTIDGVTNEILYSQHESGTYQYNGTNWNKLN